MRNVIHRSAFLRRVFSVLLTVVLTFGYAGLFAGLFAFRANAYTYDVAIGVPETIYMTPQNNYGTATTSVKYYVNNTVNSSGSISLDASNSVTTGKFYIYGSNISSVKSVSVDGASLSDFSVSKSGNLSSDTSFTMTLSSGLSSSQTRVLEWSIVCNLSDGTVETFYAYTVAYTPYLSPVFAAGKCKNTRGTNSFGSGMSWVSGIHGISGEAGYYPYDSFLPVYDSSHPVNGDGEDDPSIRFSSSQQCGLPTKGGWYTTKEYGYNYGDETLCVFERSGEAYINVDTSRYTNLNQVPNLTCGLWVSDAEGISNNNVYGYVGKLTNASDRITSGRNWYTRSNTSPSEWNASCTIWGGDRSTGRTNSNYKLTNVRMNMSVPSGWIYIRGALKTASGGDNCFCILDNYLNVIQVDKSSLRNRINECIKTYWKGNYTLTSWNSYKTALKNAANALGNPANTNVTATLDALNTAVGNLQTQTYYNLNYNSINTNLWAPVLLSGSSNGLTCSYNATTGVITLNGTQTGSTGNLMQTRFVPTASSYRVTVEQVGGSKTAGNGCVVLDMAQEGGGNTSSRLNVDFNESQSVTKTFNTTTAGECTQIRLWVWHNSTQNVFNNFQFRVKVESGSSATAMSPTGQTITIGGNTTVARTSFPEAPSRTGYTFKGWSTSSTATSGSTSSVSVGCNQTLYAIWAINSHKLDVNGYVYTVAKDSGANDGGLGNKAKATVYVNNSVHSNGNNVNDFWQDVTYNHAYRIEITPIAGWKMAGVYDVTAGVTYTTNSNTDTNLTVSGTMPDKAVSFRFAMRPKVIKLTLNNQSATSAGTSAVYYKFEQSAAQDTSNTSSTGTYFTSGNNSNNTVTGVISSITKPTRTGYTFGGYYTQTNGGGTQYIDANGSFVNNAYSTVTADTTLYAKWTIHTGTLTVDPNGGTWNGSAGTQSFTQNYNTTKTIGAPTRTGYTFTGWSLSSGANGSFSNGVYTFGPTQGANDTLTANWTINHYTVTFKNYDGTTLQSSEWDYNTTPSYSGTPAKPYDSTKHYTFSGWSPAIVPVTEAATYTAQFTGTNHSYTSSVITSATCTAPGTTKYTCSCGYSYTDSTTPAANGHTAVRHAAVAATCLASGNIEYWTCSVCGKYFSNANCTTEITQAQTVIAQKDHNYTGAVQDNGNGTHSFQCVNGCNQYGGTVNCTYGDWTKVSGSNDTAKHVCPVCGHTENKQITYNDTFIVESAALLDVLLNDLGNTADTQTDANLTLKTENGLTCSAANVTVSVTNNRVALVPDGFLTGAVTFTYTAQYDGEDYTANVKVIPASSIYYEESIFDFESGWIDAENTNAVFDAVLSEETYHGVSTSYNKYNSSTYSMGTAKYAVVSSTNKMGPTVTFSFAGTGFELYTVTDNKCGTAVVTVTGGEFEDPEMLIYNTYFGYSYNSTTNEWDDNADATTPGVYQVPVISLTGLTYDTYTVTVQPRYASWIDVIDECRFYIDALRVYDPINPAAIQAGTDIYDAYTANQEYDAHYESLREILIDAETFNAGGALTSGVADGVAFISTNGYQPHIENQKIPAELQTYIELGPKNEVCLGPGKGIAFDLTTLGGAIPAKLCIGVRAAQGSGTVTVNGTPLTVDCPTELYRNITNAVWTPNNDGTYTTHDPIVIINTSDNAVISLTKLKWSFGEKEAAKSPAVRSLKFSFSRSALDTLALTAQNEGEGTLDASAVTVTWDKDTFELGETATLTITAPATFMRAFVDGEEIAGYTELDNGMRQWTYQVTAEELGLFPADVTLEDANEYRTGALKAPQLTATEPTVELIESAIAWGSDDIMLGEAALLTVTVPAKVVSVTVNGETVTLFDLNEDGSKVFTWTVTPETAGEHVFKVTAAEGHGYASDEILTPALTVNEPAPETTTEEPTTEPATEPATEEPTGDDGAQQGSRWSFRSLLEAILNFFRKVLNLFKIKA